MADSIEAIHVERNPKTAWTEVFVRFDPVLHGGITVRRFTKYGVEWANQSQVDLSWLSAEVSAFKLRVRQKKIGTVLQSLSEAVGAQVAAEFVNIVHLLYNGLEQAPNATAAQALAYVEANRETSYLDVPEVFGDLLPHLYERGLIESADWPGLRALLNDVRSAGGPT